MNMIEEVKETLALQNLQERASKLEQLSDVFEYGHGLKKEEVIEGTKLLLSAALQETNQSLREPLFYTLYISVVHQDIGDLINWDALIDVLSSLDESQLEEALGVLGFSGQEKYLHILGDYVQNDDPEIRKWALDAIEEIKFRLSHNPDDQKEQRGA